MPTLYMLCGPSLSGKSSAAKAIVEARGATLISADDINRERGLPFGGEGLPESVWARTLEIQIDRLRQHAAAGRSVVLDDTLCYRWLRERFRSEAHQLGLDTVLLLFAVTEQEILRRHAVLMHSNERPVLSIERLADHLSRFEWPSVDENPIDATQAPAFERLIRGTPNSAARAT